jgi:hypothetical protein
MHISPLDKPLLQARAKDISHAWNKIAVRSKNFAEELVDYGNLRGNVTPKFVMSTDMISYQAFDKETEGLTSYAKKCIKDFLSKYGPKNKKAEDVTLKDYINMVARKMDDERPIRDPFIDYTA